MGPTAGASGRAATKGIPGGSAGFTGTRGLETAVARWFVGRTTEADGRINRTTAATTSPTKQSPMRMIIGATNERGTAMNVVGVSRWRGGGNDGVRGDGVLVGAE